ncbi:cadherin domain-containing protein [Caenimonas koreensis]|nr:cadherin domain-containing protein [Caenimonas koreensis]
MTATVLTAGDVAVVSYNTGQTDAVGTTADSIQIVLLKAIGSGTTIYLSDRTWNGSAFTAGASDGSTSYTAGADLPAGTVINVPIGLSFNPEEAGDAIYVYQGTTADAPTTFLFAIEIADGNTTFAGSLSGTGLVAGTTAVGIALDSATYSGPTTEAAAFVFNGKSLLQNIADASNWVGDDPDSVTVKPLDQPDISGPFGVASDFSMWAAVASGGGGVVSFQGDANVSSGNAGFNVAQLYTAQTIPGITGTSLFHPQDLIFDSVHGKFFLVDSDIGGGHNRILQGNISDLLGNPSAAPTLTTLYEDTGTTTAARLDNIEVDPNNGIVYFTHGQTFQKIVYNTANQTPVTLASFSTGNPNGSSNNFIDDFVIDFANGNAYFSSHRVTAAVDGDIVSRNYIYKISGLTPSSVANAFSFAGGNLTSLPFSPDADTTGYNNGVTFPNNGFPQQFGTIEGLALNGSTLYFATASTLYDDNGDGGFPGDGNPATTDPLLKMGGIYSYALTGNPTGVYTNIYQPTDDGDTNSQTIQVGFGPQGLLDDLEIDPVTGKLYFIDFTGDQLGASNPPGDEGIWRIDTDGTPDPVFVQGISNINGLTAASLEFNRAPTVTAHVEATPTTTEANNAPSSGATTLVQPFVSATLTDAESASLTDQLAGAVIRISGNFQTGSTHADSLTLNGVTSGTLGSGISFSYNAATGVMSLSGANTFANYAAAVALVRFNTSGDDVTAFGSATSRTIAWSVTDGLNFSDEIATTVTVVGINDAPVNTPGSAATVSEDSTSQTITGISVFDVDSNPATQSITVTLSVAHGALTMSTVVAGGVTSGMLTGNGTASVVITATQNQINATLSSGLTYTPTGNFNGPDTLTIVTNDGGFNGTDPGLTGTGTSEQDSDTKTINVTAVNDAPVVTGGTTQAAAAIFEDQPSALGETVSSLFASHFDDSIDQVSGGSSANTLAGIAVTANGSGANGDWQYFNGTVWTNIGAASTSSAVLISAATAIRFNPASNFNGTAPTLDAHLVDSSGAGITNGATVDLTTSGGTTRYSSGTVTLSETVNPVNDAPTSTNLQGDTATYIEGGAAVKLDTSGNATLADIDSADFNGGTLTVSVTGNAAASEDLISVDTSGAVTLSGGSVLVSSVAVGTYTGGTVGANFVITMNANATASTMQQVLRALQYTDTNTGNPSTAARTVTIALKDGDGVANGGADTLTATTTVNVTAVNDAPAGTDNAKTILEDNTYTFANADFGFSDPTDGGANSLQSVVFTTVPASGSLMYDADGPGGAAAVALTSGAEVPASNIALGRLIFVPVADANGTPYTSFTFQVRDNGGTVNSGVDLDQSPNTFTLNVSAVNDAPVVDLDASGGGTGFTSTFTEGAGAAQGAAVSITDTDVSLTDIDSANLGSATITLTNRQSGDVLSVNGALPGGITTTGYDSGTGVLTLSGTATKAQYQTALSQIQFSNTSQNPSAVDRTISITVTDDLAATSTAAVATVHVTPVNDAPTLDLDANNSTASGANYQSLYIPGGGAASIVDTDSAVGDVDDTNIESATITLTNAKPSDLIAASAALPGGIVASAFTVAAGVGTLTLTGSATLAQYESALELLQFSNSLGAGADTTTRTINITVNDGNVDSNTAVSTITLNQPPTVPVDTNAAGNSVTEGATAGTTVGVTASSTDPEAGGAIVYSLSDSAGGRFQINSSTGVVTVSAAGATTIDYENASSYSITAVATDVLNGSSSQTFVINVTNVAPTSPTDSDAGTNTVSEGAVNGATVGVTASATDVNGGAPIYSLANDAGGRFTINSSTGVVTVADASLLNFEAATSHSITIHAQDAAGLSSSDTIVSIAVTNVAATSAVDSDGATGGSVAEGAANGTAVGITASSTDVHGGTITYSLANNAGGRFAINSSTGVVTVANAGLLNYEAATSHDIIVHAADPSGAASSDTTFTIAVTNVAPSSPTDSNVGTNTVSEGAVNGATVGVTGASSDVNGGTITYSLVNNAGGRFAIDSATGVVTVADASLLDFETATSHNITIHAQDASGAASSDTIVAIAVTNVAPSSATDSNAATNSVVEGAANGFAVGITAAATDVHGGTITYSLADNAGGRFAIDSSTGVVTVADGTKLNFESATSHNITVHAVDSSGAASTDTVFSIAVTNVAPSSAVDSDGATGGSISEGASNGAAVGVTASSTDVNGGTITYSLANNAGGRFAINSSTGVVTVLDATLLNYETATSHDIVVHAVDPSGGSSADTTFTIQVTNVAPSSPTDSDAATNTVSEGAVNGAAVGVTAASSDVHGGIITYSLADNAGGRFAINSGTGVVTVADATLLNYESATSHNITVHAVDSSNASSTDTIIAIAVTNVAPSSAVDSNVGTNTISEGAANGDLVGVTASSSDVHGGTITYSLANNAGGRFAIDSATGVVTVANAALLNYESATSHDIVVHAVDASNSSSADATFTIQVTNVAPTSAVDSNAGTNTVSEGATNGATVGVTASASDVNGGTITYSLADDAGGRFAINSSTGVVTVADATKLDYESATSHNITVHAVDASGASSSDTTFTVTVTNVAPTTPADGNATANSISEGAANGDAVGITATSSDVHGGTVTFSLFDNAGGRFAINSSTGVVTVANASALDYETATSHTITVRATDGTDTTDQTFTIAVTDVAPVTPTDSDAGTNTVSEGAVNGATVGITGASSDVNGGTVTYSLSNSAGGRFTIDASTGVVTVANANLLDFESATSHDITVRAADASGAYTEQTFTIAVTNVVPTVPTDGNAATNTVSEAAANGALVGVTGSATDVHGGTVTYSLSDDANGRFAINASTGVVTVADASQLDFESATSHSITVRASDGTGYSEQTFTIAVANAPPSAAADVDATTNFIAENAANGTAVGITASSSDPHGGTVTFSLADNAGGRFAIDASTGVVTVANGTLLDYEVAHAYNITVRASDASSAFSDQTFTIALGDLNDVAPTITTAAAYNVFENSTLVAALASTDPDSVGTNPATFSIVGGADQALFSIVGGNLVFTAAPDYESPVDNGFNNTYVVQVQAFDGTNTTVKTITATVKDVNDKLPMIQTPSNQSINEGQTVVVALKAVDPDTVGTIPAVFSINGGADAARFSVVNGNLVFKSAPDRENPLDSDHNNVYLVQVKAFDGVNYTLKMLSVTVNDINDTAPVLTVASPISVNENTTLVATLTSTDADSVSSGPPSYSITGGADAAFFEIVGGQLKFKVAQDFNTPHDAGADNSYLVQVTSSDGIQSSNKMLTVNVLDLGLHLVGDAGPNNMVGSTYDDTFVGNGGNDRMNGRAGNDTIDGSAGIDTAIFAGNKAAYNVVVTSPGQMTVTGPDGTDGLTSVERLQFTNANVAFDLDGNAGMVVKLIGALFGAPTSHNATAVGIGIGYADEGMTELQLANLVVASDAFAQQAGSHSNTDFVNYVYHNLYGVAPTASVRAELVGLLDSHTLTQGAMAVLAAHQDVNAVNVDIVGLTAHGIDYIPY